MSLSFLKQWHSGWSGARTEEDDSTRREAGQIEKMVVGYKNPRKVFSYCINISCSLRDPLEKYANKDERHTLKDKDMMMLSQAKGKAIEIE